MTDPSHPSDPHARSEPLLVICWTGTDGATVTCCPLPRAQAQTLVRVYAQAFPRQRYWLEPAPAWIAGVALGRRRRRRSDG